MNDENKNGIVTKIARALKVVLRKILISSFFLIKRLDITNLRIGNLNIKLSRDGKGTILFIFALFVVLFVGCGFCFLTGVLLFLLLMTMYFFRDPDRVLPNRNNAVVSPCDGLILDITLANLPEELNRNDTNEYIKISVFMSVCDMHIQRIPVDCKIKQIEYIKGAFINASFDKACKDNERNIVLVERENGDNLCIVQIAGFIARRIVCHVSKDEFCKVGEKYGMIKFGSRIELYIPQHYKVEVLKGQRLVCGETVVASFLN